MQRRQNKSTANALQLFSKCGNCKICWKHTVSVQFYVTAAYYINVTYVVILSHYAGGSRSFTIRQGQKKQYSLILREKFSKVPHKYFEWLPYCTNPTLSASFASLKVVIKKNFPDMRDVSLHFYLRSFPPLFLSRFQSVAHLQLRTEAQFSG